MKASSCWLSRGRPGGLTRILTSILTLLSGALIAATSPGDQAYPRGLKAEKDLDLFAARRHFHQALDQPDQPPGMREHVAWFLYRNGFHDPQGLKLLEESQPRAAQPEATARAIRHLRGELGLSPPAPERKSGPLPDLPAAARPAARLQHARELYWAGSATKSRAAYQDLIREFPDNAALRWEISKVMASQQDYQDALGQLEVARRLQPNEPELILATAGIEAELGHRSRAVGMVRPLAMNDPAPVHLVRARAHHRAGEFIPAAREYRQVLVTRPHHEEASHGLAECSLRNNSIREAHELLQSWAGAPRTLDWDDRYQLQHQLTAPRLRVGTSHFQNTPDYETWTVGADFHMRPCPSLDVGLAATSGWFDQPGFESITRQTLQLSINQQYGDAMAIFGNIGVNDYDNDWTSLTGGLGIMLRPASSLELNLTAAHVDVVDSEPPLGISLYDLASTIGAVAGRATMDSLTASATWQPIENIEVFAKYRIATLEDDNTLDDAYAQIAWVLSRKPMVRLGYGAAYMAVEDPAPVHTEGARSTAYYYDPDNVVVHNLFLELSHHAGRKLSYGGEAHVYLQPDNDSTGYGLFGFIRYAFNDRHSLQFDARYYTQNRGRNRDQSASGHYDALNLVAVYECRF